MDLEQMKYLNILMHIDFVSRVELIPLSDGKNSQLLRDLFLFPRFEHLA